MTKKQEQNRIKMAAEREKQDKIKLKKKGVFIQKLLTDMILGMGKFRPLNNEELSEMQKMLNPISEFLASKPKAISGERYSSRYSEW